MDVLKYVFIFQACLLAGFTTRTLTPEQNFVTKDNGIDMSINLNTFILYSQTFVATGSATPSSEETQAGSRSSSPGS